ncbi:MAG: hypothetical protein ACLQFW_20670, partial [Xanthobacteraceae bacterium]
LIVFGRWLRCVQGALGKARTALLHRSLFHITAPHCQSPEADRKQMVVSWRNYQPTPVNSGSIANAMKQGTSNLKNVVVNSGK